MGDARERVPLSVSGGLSTSMRSVTRILTGSLAERGQPQAYGAYAMKPTSTVQFQDASLDVFDHNNARWVRSTQIGRALGLAMNADAVNKIFKRHRREFAPEMTALIWVDSGGGVQKTRVFSARGAALIAMLANTEKAAAFRAWALDVLEAAPAPALPAGPETRTAQLHEMLGKMATETRELVEHNRALERAVLATSPLWRRLKSYRERGFSNMEMAKLTDLSPAVIRKHLRAMEAAGLLAPPANLARLSAHARATMLSALAARRAASA